MRLLTSALLAASVAGGTLATAAAPAVAEGDIYQSWSYFQVAKGAFAYASEGAGSYVPEDGSIEGYRWSATPMGSLNAPRADLDELTFDAICGGDEAEAGEKRVAVIVDFGTPADTVKDDKTPAPYADCAVVPAKATGLQVLDAVAETRTESSSFGPMLCAIDGYPSTGCGTQTDKASATDETVDIAIKGDRADAADTTKKDDDSSTSLLVGGGVVVALLVLLGGVIAVRRKS